MIRLGSLSVRGAGMDAMGLDAMEGREGL